MKLVTASQEKSSKQFYQKITTFILKTTINFIVFEPKTASLAYVRLSSLLTYIQVTQTYLSKSAISIEYKPSNFKNWLLFHSLLCKSCKLPQLPAPFGRTKSNQLLKSNQLPPSSTSAFRSQHRVINSGQAAVQLARCRAVHTNTPHQDWYM